MTLQPFLSIFGTLVDARSPAEFLQGHIPGAVNIPLLNDQERILVGTCYKKQGRNAAVEMGFDLIGHKMGAFIRKARRLPAPLNIYCWRGGLRSQSLTWILQTGGIPSTALHGGYKLFRKSVLALFDQPRNLQILAGYTGCGKTNRLHEMALEGKQVLDLELLANHRGSAFGEIHSSPQPSCEHFENLIAVRLFETDPADPLWVEDESHYIGNCKIPDSFYAQMQSSCITLLERPKDERLERIVTEYGNLPLHELLKCLTKIKKRLGGLRTEHIRSLIERGNVKEAFSDLIEYYDKKYAHSLNRRLLALKM